MKYQSKSKKKLVTILFVILSLQLIVVTLKPNIAKIPNHNNELATNNIGAPNYFYNDFIMNDDLVHLLKYNKIDIMNISDNNDIKKVKSIDLGDESYFHAFWGHIYRDHTIWDWYNKSVYFYDVDPYFGTLNTTALRYNETYYTEIDEYTCSFPKINNSHWPIETKYFQEDKTVFVVFAYINFSRHIEENSIEIYLLTFDVTNKTQPIIISPPTLFYKSTGLEEFGETDFLVREMNRYSFHDNHLFLVRAYSTSESSNYYDSDSYKFSYGFMKAWDISNHSNPHEVFTKEVNRWYYSSIIICNDLLFYCTDNYGYDLYNCSNLQDLQYMSSFKNNDNVQQIIVSENLLYLVCSDEIQILNIENPKEIKKLGKYVPHFQGNGDFTKGNLEEEILYLIRSSEFEDRCFYILDCNNPNKPKMIYPLGTQLGIGTLLDLKAYTLFLGIPAIATITIITVTIVLVRRRRKRKKKELV
ncbi:MAG: hypothetical protein JJE41_08305 [Candidatus Heimdallarchaeota archaeon]|nr:hypothetical protein [Candidatus Heimdallarchaeota archaeon]